MSKYIYSEGDQTVIIPHGSIIWNDQTQDDSTTEYFDANDTIVSNCTIDETYASAIDPDNTTQYLSILDGTDSAELTLEDLNNLTIEAEDVVPNILLSNNTAAVTEAVEGKTAEDDNKSENAEVVVFTMNGSDDLYGIQLMQDETGQVQKYQFKFRQTPEGQLEPIPETVTVLPNDEGAEEEEAEQLQPEVQTETDVESQQYFLVATSGDIEIDNVNQGSESEEVSIKREVLDSIGESELILPDDDLEDLCPAAQSAAITTKGYNLHSVNHIKNEHYLKTIEECNEERDESCNLGAGPLEIAHLDEDTLCQPLEQNVNEDFLESNPIMAPGGQIEVEFETEIVNSDRLPEAQTEQEVAVQLSREYLDQMSKDTTVNIMRYREGSESFLYKHEDITPPVKSAVPKNECILKEPKNKRQSAVNAKYYVVYPEKENLMSAPPKSQQSTSNIPRCMISNSRSVLRSSVAKNQEKSVTDPVKSARPSDLYLKRFSRNKDALLAKRFHSFLSRTTIPQAPVRQQRQPRKQAIKPIDERSQEEIIVQEVLISSNGFVENGNKIEVNGPLRVTAIVELSDSEDDSNAKSNRKKPTKKRKLDKTIIVIHSDEETPLAEDSNLLKAPKQGRPPSKVKRKKGYVPPHQTATTDSLLKKEIICPYCPKTFPSQNSLNTHIIHHNLENSLQNKARMNRNTRQSLLPKPEYNHKCDKCTNTFKNKILLEKHKCTKKQNSLNCSVCLKQFADVVMLNIHKKSHTKSNLIRNTSLTKVSPRKSYLKRPTGIRQSPRKTALVKTFKCNECPKVCDSQSKLVTHMRLHTKFACSFCKGTFNSKITLDSHVRTNCVKNKANNKRMSYTVRKSFIHTPPRRMSLSKHDSSLNQSLLGVKVNCDKCPMKFNTFRNLYTHKVQRHGMSTPDKNLLTKPKSKVGVCDPRAAHGGVPANARLQVAFAELRQRLAEVGDLTIQ